MASKSILDTEAGRCYWCHAFIPTDLHHIYFGNGRRKVSDRLGFTVYLCRSCHEGTYGVHGMHGHELDMKLKQECQQKYEENHTREEFIQAIGRSYL